MNVDLFPLIVNVVKMIAIFLLMVQLVPVLVWVERRGSAFIQNRYGPNRVGFLGLFQLLADAVKFAFKEEFIPEKSRRFIYYLAPVVALIPGAIAFNSIPLSVPVSIDWGGQTYQFAAQGFHLGIGIVFVLGISSLGAYALLLAGWGSSNKYSLFGALRASAQMISYELGLGLAIVGCVLIYGTFDFQEMIDAQAGPLSFTWGGRELGISWLPNWGIFYQPVGFVLLFVAVFAETNRLPFDLPEAEAELVAGFHTEYGGLKMLMFYIGEYGHMMVASALLATFYFGGYDIPFLSPDAVKSMLTQNGFTKNAVELLTALVFHVALMTKILLFLWVFIWVRWTLPRFRYDQLMDLGWKTLLPWALGNTVVTAVFMYLSSIK